LERENESLRSRSGTAESFPLADPEQLEAPGDRLKAVDDQLDAPESDLNGSIHMPVCGFDPNLASANSTTKSIETDALERNNSGTSCGSADSGYQEAVQV